MTPTQRNALLVRLLALYLIGRSFGRVFAQLANEAAVFEQLGRKLWMASFDSHDITNRAIPAIYPTLQLLVGLSLWLLPARWVIAKWGTRNAT